jgi:hypothetical protein
MQESAFECLVNDVSQDCPHADVGGWRGEGRLLRLMLSGVRVRWFRHH